MRLLRASQVLGGASLPFNSGRSICISCRTHHITTHLVQILSLLTEVIEPALSISVGVCDDVIGPPIVHLG